MNTPSDALEQKEETILDRHGDFRSVTVTTKRATVNSDTYSLDGIIGAKLTTVHLRRTEKSFWTGWIMLLGGLPLGCALVYTWDKFPLIGLAVSIWGAIEAWQSRRNPCPTVRIVLERADGQKIVCYEQYLGLSNEQHYQRIDSAQEVAEAIGLAIGRR